MLNNAEIIYSADGTTQKLIAHVQDTLIADKDYGLNDQFIYAGVLYRVTVAITQNDPIVLTGTDVNVVASKVVADQVYSIDDAQRVTLNDGDAYPFYTYDGVKRKTPWSNIKDKLKAYFDPLYVPLIKEVAVNITTFNTAGTGAYYAYIPLDGIAANKIINVGMKAYNGSWRILNFYRYSSQWVVVSNLNSTLAGTLYITYIP